jgi:hypothetical protein
MVDAERGRGRVVRALPSLAADLGQGKPKPSQILRHRHQEVSGFLELVEVFLKEAVLPIVAGRGPVLEPDLLIELCEDTR